MDILFFKLPVLYRKSIFRILKLIMKETAKKEKQTVNIFPLILVVQTTLHWWLEDPTTLVVLVGPPYIGGWKMKFSLTLVLSGRENVPLHWGRGW